MFHYICETCGAQFAARGAPPDVCPICADERQYMRPSGQTWTTLDVIRLSHHNRFETLEPGLVGIITEPGFAIGQRPLLLQAKGKNILWDCNALIDGQTIATVKALGGLSAIAVSHPHFYGCMAEWSQAFGGVPIYVHADDRQWVTRPDKAILYWDGPAYELADGVTLVRCGGHFEGSAVLHWADGAEGKGALFTADTIHVAGDRQHVTFMRSFPNLIPISTRKVECILQAVEPYAFDRIYGGWPERVIDADAKPAVKRSAERYIKAITD
jgi:glyoxylase-like metal-dependent hydrolase (beta-lactamase superfamily II)